MVTQKLNLSITFPQMKDLKDKDIFGINQLFGEIFFFFLFFL